MKCFSCPRKCGANRSICTGLCGEEDKLRIAKILHNFMWEEPPISRTKGSCAIFFSGCNLKCLYCQNHLISKGGKGKQYTIEEFIDLLKEIDKTDNETIEFITPTHFVSQILSALKIYKPKKPIVYNTSSYEFEAEIEKLAPYIDIFLPDFKYFDKDLSKELSMAGDYFEYASKAILKMCKLKPNIYKDDKLVQGVIIRHLVLPNHVKDSLKILEFIKKNIDDPVVSVMSQFTPAGILKDERKLTSLEYKIVLSKIKELGLKGFIQDLSSASENFIPDF